MGGRYIATKISVKHGMRCSLAYCYLGLTEISVVTLAGAALFLLFGLGYGYEALLSFSVQGHESLDPAAGLPTRPDSEDALYRRK
jgi:hypothetical protein